MLPLRKKLATLALVAFATVVAANNAAAPKTVCVSEDMLSKVRAFIFESFAKALRDPEGKGQELLLQSKEMYDELVAARNETRKHKGFLRENEKDETLRVLSSCADYPGWADADGWVCEEYSAYDVCGSEAWPCDRAHTQITGSLC